MMWTERILGTITVAKSVLNIIELAIGTVNAAIDWSIVVTSHGTYPIKNSINGPPAQNR